MLLDRGNSSYAQLLAASTLTKLIQGLTIEQRIHIRSYTLSYLATRTNLQHFVIQALVTLLAKITKLGWFDAYKGELVFQNLLEDVKKFLQVKHSRIYFKKILNMSYIYYRVLLSIALLEFKSFPNWYPK